MTMASVNTGADDCPLELKQEPDAIVRLWLNRNTVDPSRYLSVLDKLLDCRATGADRKATSSCRFVGACRERKAGIDYVCMLFCLERDRSRAGMSGARLSVD